jgi:DNA helicase HerA-like ATPase
LIVTIPAETRKKHVAIFGSTGSGKSTLLRNMIAWDVSSGAGVTVVDPRGVNVNRKIRGSERLKKSPLFGGRKFPSSASRDFRLANRYFEHKICQAGEVQADAGERSALTGRGLIETVRSGRSRKMLRPWRNQRTPTPNWWW